jgi:hypothetical protein
MKWQFQLLLATFVCFRRRPSNPRVPRCPTTKELLRSETSTTIEPWEFRFRFRERGTSSIEQNIRARSRTPNCKGITQVAPGPYASLQRLM